MTDLIGYLAAALGTFLLVPQILKTIHTKKVDDLSLVMIIAYIFSCVLWAIYGFLLMSLPIILCNCIAGCIGMLQGFFLWKYRKKS